MWSLDSLVDIVKDKAMNNQGSVVRFLTGITDCVFSKTPGPALRPSMPSIPVAYPGIFSRGRGVTPGILFGGREGFNKSS
jgi:hypothetical protein